MNLLLLPLILACTPADRPPAPPAAAPPAAAPRPEPRPSLRLDGSPIALPGLCETSGAARSGAGPIWLADDDQRDALFSWQPGQAPARHPVADKPWKDAEGLALDDAGGLWLTGGMGRRAKDGKVGKRAVLARFVDGPAWTVAFQTRALRPGKAEADLAPLLQAVAAVCPACGPLDAAAGDSDGHALDVEGLAWSEGRLLLGLRAPVPGGDALVLALNPTALQTGAPLTAVVSAAWPLPLGGRGIRDLSPAAGGGLLVLAGGPSSAETPGGALYAWSPGSTPALLGTLPPLDGPAEALVHDGPGAAWLFLDEGRRLGTGLRPNGPHADADGDLDCGANGPTDWAHAVRVAW